MAGGLDMEIATQYIEKVTFCVIVAAIVVSFGGFIFGYVAILGQVTVQDVFYDLFLSDLFKKNPREFDYCKYGRRSFDFPLYAGPLYLAGALASLLSYPLTTKYGRRKMIIISGVFSFIGGASGTYPYHIALLIFNQVMLGIGIGIGNQAILLYLCEIAPPCYRGTLSMVYHLATNVAILAGNTLKVKLSNDNEYHPQWLFYFAWGFPALPALFLFLGGLKLVPDTPNGLVERGSREKARKALEKLRGTRDVDTEFRDISSASEFISMGNNWRSGFLVMQSIFARRNRAQLVLAISMPLFHNLTGVVFVLAYTRMIFLSLGTRDSSLYSTAFNASLLVVSTILSMATVDKLGRRALLISGGVLMIICQAVIAIMLGSNSWSDQMTTHRLSFLVLVFIGVFVLAYGSSWGHLGWTVPIEILTLETRSVGTSIVVSINFVFCYLVLQFMAPLLCAFDFGLFLFFAGWIVVMTIFVCLFIPETKGVPIEQMSFLLSKHWFWKRFVH